MMRRPFRVSAPLFCSWLAISLLADPMGFLRMALLCSVVHECGHLAVYIGCTRCVPKIHMTPGGMALDGAQVLSSAQELAVLCAGPLANFLLAGGLYLCALYRASYGAYFLAAVSLCTGVYNLLPVGVLDGARIVQLLVRTEYVGRLERAQRALLTVFAAVGVGLALCTQMPTPARIAALTAPLYLLVQQAANKT